MSWYLARSLETLRNQINKKAPNRDKSSDGTIGDEAHSSTSSDHNPDQDDTVCALDITHDPDGGMDCQILAEKLWAGKDYRIKYIIWNKQISNPDIENWAWRPYTGSNPHTMHCHTSVKQEGKDDPQEWKSIPVYSMSVTTAGPMPKLVHGNKGLSVEVLQSMLGVAVDGYFGSETEEMVKEAQKKANIVVDGIVGPYTWGALANETD